MLVVVCLLLYFIIVCTIYVSTVYVHHVLLWQY